MALTKNGKYFYYDFMLKGERYQGSTGCTDRDKAKAFEDSIRAARGLDPKPAKDVGRDPGVYFLRAATIGLIKIGRSGDMSARIDQIRNANADEITVVAQIKTERYVQAEELIHDLFREKHAKREWFRITDEDIDFAVRYWDRLKDSKDILNRHTFLPIERERLYTVEDLALTLHCSKATIRTFIRKGKLGSVRHGHLVRIPGSEWARFIEANSVGGNLGTLQSNDVDSNQGANSGNC